MLSGEGQEGKQVVVMGPFIEAKNHEGAHGSLLLSTFSFFEL